jgi:N-hydroxyarylamine O-acetyltransferase
MNTTGYLARIEYGGPLHPDIETLRGLQLAHLLTVPFENLDIGLGARINLSREALWDKIVVGRRGGFCYELNGLFAWLLEQVGFEVTCLNARDYHPEDDSFGIDFDHIALMVRAPGDSTRWLADVGYGDTFTEPLNIDEPGEQIQRGQSYRLEPFRGGYQLWQTGYDGKRERHYFFDLTPHRFPSEYEATCTYHQTSPQSIFTQKRIITRLTREGRVSLSDGELILTRGGEQTRQPLANAGEFFSLIPVYFGFRL